MSSTWHDTKTLYTKLLQVVHDFPEQTVIRPWGKGAGIVNVTNGFPQVHPCIAEICRQPFIQQVHVGKEYLMVTLTNPRHWGLVLGEIQHIVARHCT